MKYIILPETPTHYAMVQLGERLKRAYNKAEELIKSIPEATAWHYPHTALVGGVAGIIVTELPKQWVWIDEAQKIAMPNGKVKSQFPLIQKIASLPVVTHAELNKVVGFEEQITPDNKSVRVPGYDFVGPHILISVYQECKFTPNADLKEILVSEWRTLRDSK